MKKSKFSKNKTGKKGKGANTSQPAFSMTIFGVPLESICRFDPVKGWGLPPLIKRAIERIRTDIKQEGIFRLSAQANLVDDVRRAYDSGNAVDLSTVEINVCCGLLKLFLREMPEPLFPFRLYKAFVSFQEDNFERDKEYIKILLSNLAGPRKPLFFELFRLLHEISKESEHNFMDASNLAVVIGPTVLRCESSDLKTMMADASTVNEVAATFISHFDVLEEPSTESFLAVAEATSAYTDSASSLHWNEGDVFFLRKELDNNAWLASFRGEEGEIPSEKFKMLTFLDLGKGAQNPSNPSDEPSGPAEVVSSTPGYEEATPDVEEQTKEDGDSQTIDALIGFCAQSCMVMQQMQDENEQLRAALKSLQSLTKTLIPLVPEASESISEQEIDNLSKPLSSTSKSGIAFLNEQLESIITAREKTMKENGAPLAAHQSLRESLSMGNFGYGDTPPLQGDIPPPLEQKPPEQKKEKSSKKKHAASEPKLDLGLDLQEVKANGTEETTSSRRARSPGKSPGRSRSPGRAGSSGKLNRRQKMSRASHFGAPPVGLDAEKLGEEGGEEELDL